MTDPNHPHAPSGTDSDSYKLSRSTFLRGAAGAMVGMSPLLAAACGGSGGGGSGAAASTGGGKPVRGGTIRAGCAKIRGTEERLDVVSAFQSR